MITRHAYLLSAIVAAALAAGCGSDGAPAKATATAARIDPTKDPHTITCGDLANKEASAALSRRAGFTLAEDASVRDMSRLRAAQSIFFAMTELCKSHDASYTPAADAVKAVENGEYIADLEAP